MPIAENTSMSAIVSELAVGVVDVEQRLQPQPKLLTPTNNLKWKPRLTVVLRL